MARFMVKVLLLACTLLIGMLLGIQQAEHGIFSILGVHTFQGDIEVEMTDEGHEAKSIDHYIKRIDGDEVEVGYVNDPFSLKELEEKEEEWALTHSQNRYSKIGNALGEMVYSASQKGAEWFANQLAKLL